MSAGASSREEFRVQYADQIEELFPYSISPAALKKLLGDEAWQQIVDSILDTLPPSIVAQVTERDVVHMVCACMRGILAAYLVARFPLESFLEDEE